MRFYIDGLKKLLEVIEGDGGVVVYFENYGGGNHAFATIHYKDADGNFGKATYLIRTEGSGKTTIQREIRVEVM